MSIVYSNVNHLNIGFVMVTLMQSQGMDIVRKGQKIEIGETAKKNFKAI